MVEQFGTYALSPGREAVRQLAGRCDRRSRGLGSALRKLAVVGRAEPFDIEPRPGYRMRLWPSQNHHDKRVFLDAGFSAEGDAASHFHRIAAAAEGETFHVVDVGANVGVTALLAATAAQAAGKTLSLLAIEPHPALAERLAFNLSASGVAARIEAVAVSDDEGVARLASRTWNLGQSQIGGPSGVEVPVRRLAALIGEAGFSRIDLMKVDVEGHEARALKPYFATVERALWPATLMVETDFDADGAVERFLTGLGYHVTFRGGADIVLALGPAPQREETGASQRQDA